MTLSTKLTTIGMIVSNTMYWLLNPVRNAIRSTRTLVVYKAAVWMMTMKAGKRARDPPGKEGVR
jgi:hypothetical protein